ncbi:MAG TPA: ABC transporter permease [Gammaproteobacteria bacterium]|nr:ABC transporter permease [Gammaproteobacteria bacterium]
MSKVYSLINVAGLAIGLASVVLISLFVRHELGYDSFWPNADRIYRISRDYYATNGAPNRVPASNNGPVAAALLDDFPEIESSARVYGGRTLLSRDDVAFYEDRFRWADNSLFQIFAFDWLAGDSKTALAEPASIVLTETLAKKYFPGAAALGRPMLIENRIAVTVTGVIRDLPPNTHLSFDALGSMKALPDSVSAAWNGNTDFHTYFSLRAGANIRAIEQRIPEFMNKRIAADASTWSGMTIMNVRDIHVRSTRDEEWEPSGSIARIASFTAIAALILLIACINFMNLSTARSAKRAREVGVRKSLGAARRQLVLQFLGESIGMAVVGTLVATVLVELALPKFSAFSGVDLALEYFGPGGVALQLGALALLVGLVAGSYPAFYLSAFEPARVLKGEVSRGREGAVFRNVLVVAQFAIAIALLIGTTIVYQQDRFARSRDLGFDKNQIVVLAAPPNLGLGAVDWEPFRDEIARAPGVAGVTASHYTPFSWDDNRLPVRRQGSEDFSRIQFMAVDYDFFATYRIETLAGHVFSREFAPRPAMLRVASGAAPDVVLNESAARMLGWAAPEAVDKPVEIGAQANWSPARVIGVVPDTYFESVALPVRPMIYVFGADPASQLYGFIRTISIRVTGDDLPATLARIDALWREHVPGRPVVRHFLDDDFDALYRSEQRQAQLLTFFSGLAIAIACLGLLGLAWFSTERRVKEIGIRKTMGGAVWDVVLLFTSEFSRLVLLASLVAWPLAYFVMQRWLAGFAYRIEMGPLAFVGGAAVALAVAFVTVGAVAARAAAAKPVLSLRHE